VTGISPQTGRMTNHDQDKTYSF